MIRLRLFSDIDFYVNCHKQNSKLRAINPLSVFRRYLDTQFDENPVMPFRDAESLQFLRESFGITFASNDDWYSVIAGGTRNDITCLYDSIKSALGAIILSKRGIYSHYFFAEEKEWKALASLPIDILIAGRMADYNYIVDEIPYIIENYPYDGKEIEVYVNYPEAKEKDFCTFVSDNKSYGTDYGLRLGKDGRYYSDWIYIDSALRWCWLLDLEAVVDKIDKMRKDRFVLIELAKTYTVFELSELWHDNDPDYMMMLKYTDEFRRLEYGLKRGILSKEKFEASVQALQSGDSYQEYLYFRNTFKVTVHFAYEFENVISRRLPILIVDKNVDGTYKVSADITVKYPSLEEILTDVIPLRSAERESFVLIVDVDEVLNSVEYFERAYCGFRVRENSVDIYDAYEGAQLFGEALKEALQSGRCEVDKRWWKGVIFPAEEGDSV